MEMPFDVGVMCPAMPWPPRTALVPAGGAFASRSTAAAGPGPLPSGITRLTAASLTLGPMKQREAAAVVLDKLGAASAIAQRLPAPITSAPAMLRAHAQAYAAGGAAGGAPSYDYEHRVYVAFSGRAVLGLVKVGRKDLFVSFRGALREAACLAVLDFFVVASHRRQGVGKRLFEAMLASEGVPAAWLLAFDRPSLMCAAFLRRHYALHAFTPQANNYVLFDEYFTRPHPRMPVYPPAPAPEPAAPREMDEPTASSIMEAEAARYEAPAVDRPPSRLVVGPLIPAATDTRGGRLTHEIDLGYPAAARPHTHTYTGTLSSRADAPAAPRSVHDVPPAGTPPRSARPSAPGVWTPASTAAPFATAFNSPESPTSAPRAWGHTAVGGTAAPVLSPEYIIPGYTGRMRARQ